MEVRKNHSTRSESGAEQRAIFQNGPRNGGSAIIVWSEMYSTKIILSIIPSFVVAVLSFLIGTMPALAHAPHDHVKRFAISPDYAHDKTIIAIVRADLFLTNDSGSTWQRISPRLPHRGYLSAVAFSLDKSAVAYVATSRGEIYASQDGGMTWVEKSQSVGESGVNLLVVSPSDSNVLYAAGFIRNLYRSADMGRTWNLVLNTKKRISTVTFPRDPERQLLIAGDVNGRLYLSADGKMWRDAISVASKSGAITTIEIPNLSSNEMSFFVGTRDEGVFKATLGDVDEVIVQPMSSGLSDTSIRSLAASPNYSKDSNVFVSTWRSGVFVSDDGARTWQKSSAGLTTHPQADEKGLPHFSRLQLSNDFDHDRTIFVAAFDGLFRSEDAGRTWEELRTLKRETIISAAMSPNYAIDGTLAVGTYRAGAYISRDRGQTWRKINAGLFVSQSDKSIPRIYQIAFSPAYTDDSTLFLSTRNVFSRSENSGNSWQQVDLEDKKPWWLWLYKKFYELDTGSSRPRIAFSPKFLVDRAIVLGTPDGDVFKSMDGGNSFEFLTNLGAKIFHLAISPAFPSDGTLFAGSANEVFRSADGGKSWDRIVEGIVRSGKVYGATMKIAISPDYRNDGLVVVGTADGLLVSDSRGDYWRRISGNTTLATGVVESVAFSPYGTKQRALLVWLRGTGLYRSLDGAETFSRVGEQLVADGHSLEPMRGFPPSVSTLTFSPTFSLDQTVYGASETVLLRSTDGGERWETVVEDVSVVK